MMMVRYVIVLSVALATYGCKSEVRNVDEVYFVKHKIGALRLNDSSSTLSAPFGLPRGVPSCYFALVLDGVPVTDRDSVDQIVKTMRTLRLHVALTAENAASNVLHEVECGTDEMLGIGGWHAPDACYVLSLEPLPQLPHQQNYPSGTYPNGKDGPYLDAGEVKPGVTYRLSVEVVSPVALTNTVSLWLDCFRPEPKGTRE